MHTEVLWEEFYQPLKKFVRNRVGSDFAADDIVQDVFMKIHTRLNQLNDEQKIRSWIYQITRHTIIDYYRKKKPAEALPENLKDPEADDESGVIAELSECLRPMIRRLPPKYREALELTEWGGYTQKRLSEELGISFSGAKSRVQRARAKLKQMLLACCDFEFDRSGNVMDFEPKQPDGNLSGPCGCG